MTFSSLEEFFLFQKEKRKTFFFFLITSVREDVEKLEPLSIFFLNFIYIQAALGLCCCALAFSSCGERGLLFVVVRGLLIAVASLVEHGLQARGLQQMWCAGSVVWAHGLSCSAACGIFPDQGSNPCPLHWQADSQPLHRQGSPCLFL